jgi:MYXO-CTERM domain-containing protein
MFTLLFALFSPDAAACSLASSEPVASFPEAGANDAALNQRLLIEFSGGGGVETSDLEVFQEGGGEMVSIPGSTEWDCISYEASGASQGVLAFSPEGGAWPGNASISWNLGGTSFSGTFQTTDWLSAGNAPQNDDFQGYWIDWIEADGMCTFQDALSARFDLSASNVEAGSVLEIWMERDGAFKLEYQQILSEGGDLDVEVEAYVSASTMESCFHAVFVAPDGQEAGEMEGPCLVWSLEGPFHGGHIEDDGLFCATAANGGSTTGFFFGLMGLVGLLRRQR